ncbi:MAG: response regulator [Candidatus Omnitrophota bacterium]
MVKEKKKLLIVDDEKDICKFAKLIFQKRGFLVYTALSGGSAVKIAKRVKPDIALLDLYLKRGISGLETLRKIKKAAPLCKCVMVTWEKEKSRIKEAKELGVVSYLTKPLTIEQLLKAVKRISRSRKGVPRG